MENTILSENWRVGKVFLPSGDRNLDYGPSPWDKLRDRLMGQGISH
ncbi:MAG: hypothetical protein QNJ72_18910 [Pleurocapsa sp. MO_226.B13]|nr:hypothetical protein [Pleurocapsa sp. MO_226.B13]